MKLKNFNKESEITTEGTAISVIDELQSATESFCEMTIQQGKNE